MNLKERITNPKAKIVFGLIIRQGTVSKNELLEQTGMTVSTLTRMLDELLQGKFIQEVGLGESTGGRRPILYQANAAYGYVFGLDISRVYSRMILFDLHLNKLEVKEWAMNEENGPDFLIDEIVRWVDQVLNERGDSRELVLGVGVGAVGPLDMQRRIILNPLHFPSKGWENVEIGRVLEDQLHLPVILDNGANAAILGEYWADRAHEYRHLLYVHAGAGLRSSMMTDGKIFYGAVDMEGAVGQMIVQSDGIAPREKGGNYGSLEAYVSIYALEQAASKRLKQGRTSLLHEIVSDMEQLQFSHMVTALKARDPLMIELFTQSATYFGIGLANLLNILHPEKVLLGGQLITSHDLFFQVTTQVAVQNTYYYPDYQVVFSKGKLGDEAVATGAAKLVIDQLTI